MYVFGYYDDVPEPPPPPKLKEIKVLPATLNMLNNYEKVIKELEQKIKKYYVE